MKLEAFAVITELDQRQQERFIEQLERYGHDDEIMYGLTQSLLILGYRVVGKEGA